MTEDFPVLSAGPTPHTPLDSWDFSIVGEVDEPRRWTWEEFRAVERGRHGRRPRRDQVVEAGPHCDNALVTLVRSDTRVWIGFQGMRSLEVAL